MTEDQFKNLSEMKQKLVEQMQLAMDNPVSICGAPLKPNVSLEEIMSNINCDLEMAKRVQEYRWKESRGAVLPTTKQIMEVGGLTLDQANRWREEVRAEIEKLRKKST